MLNYYFTANLDNETTLCLAPISEARAALAAEEIEDTSGYFLYEFRHTNTTPEVKVLARVASDEAALRLREMLQMA